MPSSPVAEDSRRRACSLRLPASRVGRGALTRSPTCPPSRLQPDGRRVLATPRLGGTILPGITRDSILQLTRAWGECEVEERPVTIAEVRRASQEGRLLEVFGSGTACIVQPVGTLVRCARGCPDEGGGVSAGGR